MSIRNIYTDNIIVNVNKTIFVLEDKMIRTIGGNAATMYIKDFSIVPRAQKEGSKYLGLFFLILFINLLNLY
jgi:hypothetical protein